MDRLPPRDLRALLKFCMETTRSEDASGDANAEPMDEERRAWLSAAIDGMSVNVAEELSKAIAELLDESVVMDADAESVERQEEAFDFVDEWTEDLDMANNFHKLGGFQVNIVS